MWREEQTLGCHIPIVSRQKEKRQSLKRMPDKFQISD